MSMHRISKIIDFHTHAFPDSLAGRAIQTLISEAPDVKAWLDGRLSSLISSMDQNNIENAVLCCIATKPSQFLPILNWCREIRCDRIIPFPSVHPADPQCLEQIDAIKQQGFKGIKFHPYYQDFYADQPGMYEIYQKCCDLNLMLVMHTGYDIAFPRIPRADPQRILKIISDFPKLKFITTHLGGWEQWDQVEKFLIGKPIYMEISFALEYLSAERARQMFLAHPPEYLLFGTDSPWTDQKTTLSLLRNLQLPEGLLNQILSGNASRLLSQ